MAVEARKNGDLEEIALAEPVDGEVGNDGTVLLGIRLNDWLKRPPNGVLIACKDGIRRANDNF